MSKDTLEQRILLLRQLLESLPSSLPEPTTTSYSFHLDPDDVEDLGYEGALNRMLENTLGLRIHGLTLRERGSGIIGVVQVLEEGISKCPKSAILEKWIDDLIASSQSAGAILEPIALKKSAAYSARMKESTPKTRFGIDKTDSQWADARYIDVDEEIIDRSKGGATPDPYIVVATIPCYRASDTEQTSKLVRCIASHKCNTTYVWPRKRKRLLDHISHCTFLPPSLRTLSDSSLSSSAPAAKVAEFDASRKRPLDADTNSDSTQSPAKKLGLPSGGLNTTQSSASTPSKSASQSAMISGWTRTAGKKELKARLDNRVINVLCENTLPPQIVNSLSWKEMFLEASPPYKPACASTIRDIQIPETAAYIRGKQLEYLRTQSSLTLSFDGGSNRRNQSFYTVHVTTMDRRVFLLCADHAPRKSHNAQYICDLLKQHIIKIGSERFAAVISDNASNVRAGRTLVSIEFPSILNLQDAVHHLHNTCKDLCRLPTFEKVIEITRSVIRFFSHSADATAHVQFIMSEFKITCWLQKIGKARFATIYYSCKSLLECLPAIAGAVDRKLINLTSCDPDGVFSSGSGSATLLWLQMELTNLVALLEPCARSIKCLESSHSTPATVMKFWVATLGCYDDLLKSSEFKRMPKDVLENIRLILNCRFKAMINNAPSDCYLASLFLDPDFRSALAIDEPNPLAATFVIRTRHGNASSLPDIPIRMSTILRVGKYLCETLLRNEYSLVDKCHSILKDIRDDTATGILNKQIVAYARGDWPFDTPRLPATSTLQWWKNLLNHPSANLLALLAIKLYSICANSMADERTMSIITRLNTRLRSRQDVSTLIDQVQISTWRKYGPESPAPEWKDIDVRFRDIKQVRKSLPQPQGVKSGSKTAGEDSEDGVDQETQENDLADDTWLDDTEADSDLEELSNNRKTFDVSETVDISFYKFRDLLSPSPVLPPAREVSEVETILPRKELPTAKFVFSLK